MEIGLSPHRLGENNLSPYYTNDKLNDTLKNNKSGAMRPGDSSLSPDKNREEESYANLVKDSNIITTNSDLKRGDSEMISPLIPESKATKKNGVSPNLIIGIQTM